MPQLVLDGKAKGKMDSILLLWYHLSIVSWFVVSNMYFPSNLGGWILTMTMSIQLVSNHQKALFQKALLISWLPGRWTREQTWGGLFGSEGTQRGVPGSRCSSWAWFCAGNWQSTLITVFHDANNTGSDFILKMVPIFLGTCGKWTSCNIIVLSAMEKISMACGTVSQFLRPVLSFETTHHAYASYAVYG